MGGAELQDIVTDMLGTPPVVLEKVAKAIVIKSAEASKGVKAGGAE